MKQRIILFTLTFLSFGCSNLERVELTKEINIDWADKEQLQNYDMMYVQLNFSPFLDEKIAGKGIEELMFMDSIYMLDLTDKSRLINIICDSSNFSRGECGTFALNAGFIFAKNDTIKGIVSLGCGYYQWRFDPWNENSQDGALSDTGFDKMTKLLDEINFKRR